MKVSSLENISNEWYNLSCCLYVVHLAVECLKPLPEFGRFQIRLSSQIFFVVSPATYNRPRPLFPTSFQFNISQPHYMLPAAGNSIVSH
jgi:hypothetical protein